MSFIYKKNIVKWSGSNQIQFKLRACVKTDQEICISTQSYFKDELWFKSLKHIDTLKAWVFNYQYFL